MATQALSTMGGLSRSLVTYRPNRHMDKHRRAASMSRVLERRAAGRPLRATLPPQTGHERLRSRPASTLCSERNSESNMREMTEEQARGVGLEARAGGAPLSSPATVVSKIHRRAAGGNIGPVIERGGGC